MKESFFRRVAPRLTVILYLALLFPALAAEQVFHLGGASIALRDVTNEVDVYLTSMRLNRGANEWNVEVALSNKTGRTISAPLVLLVDSFSGTSGPLRADGTNATKRFYDFSSQSPFGLAGGGKTPSRTLAFGVSQGSPRVTTRVYAGTAASVGGALGFVRTLNEIGQPLGGVTVEAAQTTNQATSDVFSAVLTLQSTVGNNAWRFSRPGYLSAWRETALESNTVKWIPSPRLTRRSDTASQVTPVAGGGASNALVEVQFPPGVVNANSTLRLTGLNGQSLPVLLPLGWSPLQAFWVEMSAEPVGQGSVRMTPWGAIAPVENAAFVRLNIQTLQWEVLQTINGNGTGIITVPIGGSGAYALVVRDTGAFAPAAPVAGAVLLAAVRPTAENLAAGGSVAPAVSAASTNAEAVTAQATVIITNSAGALVSGTLFRGEVSEQYLLQDGTRRWPPSFENFIVAYQRPGDSRPETLHANFPMRPSMLFGAESLVEGLVRVDLHSVDGFSGGVLDENGGTITDGSLRILAAQGDIAGVQAIRLTQLIPTNFVELAGTGKSIAGAFNIEMGSLQPGRSLRLQISGVESNAWYVLARVISQGGLYGLEPRERLNSDGTGLLSSAEPATGDRLPGLTASGQYVLVRMDAPQALVSGVARNVGGAPAAGLPVRITGEPWLTFSGEGGIFKLLARAGDNSVAVSDPGDGSVGTQQFSVPANLAPVTTTLSMGATGLRVVAISPTNNAASVSRVASVTVSFNRPVNPATVVNSGARLLGTNGQTVSASVSLNLANTVLTLLPGATLDAGTLYRIVLSPDMADSAGRRIEGERVFQFTTVAPAKRDIGAQLIIYEPGATNVPASVLQNIPAYRPGTNVTAIVVQGTPGAADPGVPVVLANESTGETTTVLSKPDGSFASVIDGAEEDFVSATFVNLTGTRVYVPVSRQIFDNGFVGLYSQGGILEAESDGGPVRVYVKPEPAPTRTKLRINKIPMAELMRLTEGTQPEMATVAGGAMRIEVEGQLPEQPMDVSFPVNLTQLGYPTNANPVDVAAALAIVRDQQGVKTFEVVDQMLFEPNTVAAAGAFRTRTVGPRDFEVAAGILHTASGFASGAIQIAPLFYDFVVVPLILGAHPVVVKGLTLQNPVEQGGGQWDTAAYNLFDAELNARPLSGAYVILRNTPPLGPPGRLQRGMVHATSGADGSFLMVAPAANAGYILTATHPKFNEKPSHPVVPVIDISFAGVVFKKFVFRELNAADAPLRLNVAHAPIYPAPGGDAEVQVSAFRGFGVIPEIFVRVESVTNLVGDVPATLSDVVLTNINISNNGITTQWKGTLHADKPVQVMLKITADGEVSTYPINFGGVVPPSSNTPLPRPDTNDVHGPIVVSTIPAEGGYAGPSGEITIVFNKPVENVFEGSQTGVLLEGAGAATVQPSFQLDASQKVLVVRFPGLEPDQEYTLSLNGQGIRDLAGQPLDQRPSTPVPDSFRLRFRASPVRSSLLPELTSGRGAAISGRQLYVIDQAQQNNWLLTYDISNPALPSLQSRMRLFGQPRDLVVMPGYAYRRFPGADAVTNELVAVVGGDLEAVLEDLGQDGHADNVLMKGQYLTVFDMASPSAPRQLASPIVTYRVGSVVTKVRWSPPYLVYHEFGSDIQHLGLVNLQELIIGHNATREQLEFFREGRAGVDLNHDGDYVDEGELIPYPPLHPPEFSGKAGGYVLEHTTQKILDFSVVNGGQYIGITLTRGMRRDDDGQAFGKLEPMYRTLSPSLDISEPMDGALPLGDLAYPRWVSVFSSLLIMSNNVPTLPVVALVSLQPDNDGLQKLAVIDITLPRSPRMLNTIPLSETLLGGSLQSVRRRDDGLLELAGGRNLVLLDSRHFAVTNVPAGQTHPAVVGFIPAAGAGTRSLGASSYGYHAIAENTRGALIQTPPLIRFVNFPGSSTVVNPAGLAQEDELDLASLTSAMRATLAITPARLKGRLDLPSDLDPPRAVSHFHVYVEAPGAAGKTIELGLESVNYAGRPLSNMGAGHAPVRAISEQAQTEIGQKPRPDCGAPIRPLTAWRMSDDPKSPFYNRYLSRPFALIVNETVSIERLAELQSSLDREILFSGDSLRAFIDPKEGGNPVIGLFAAKVDTGRRLLQPVASATAYTLSLPYIMGDNPPPAGGYVAMPASFGMVAAHSGELRTDAVDMVLPSPRMPITIRRAIGNQDTYEGAFGVGWDFNYNERITELDPLSFPLGLQMPLIVRGARSDSEIAGSQDLLFNTGMGRVLHFRWISTNMPPEFSNDPLVEAFDYQNLVSDYYLPAKGQGIFDLLVKFKDGRFERLTSAGERYRYSPEGRLESIIDRFPINRHQLEYDRNGWLVRIDDRSVKADRYVEFGYYRSSHDPDFKEGLDEETSNGYLEGKVRRLRNYAGGDVIYHYSDDGFLIMREGVQVDGENGGFSGRNQTHYTYNGCKFAGIKVTKNGAPLFTSANQDNSNGKPVAKNGVGIGGNVNFDIPLDNSAATLEGQNASAGMADGSSMEFKFDKLGHLTGAISSGSNGKPAESVTTYNEDGLLLSIRHPEGNSETMVYDSENPIFRSRGNLRRKTVDPGPRGGTGYVESFNYDPRYNLKSGDQSDANGFTITYRLRTDGREIESIQYGSSGRDEFAFNDRGQMLTSVDHRGISSAMVYQEDTKFTQRQSQGANHYVYSYGNSYAARLGEPDSIAPPEGAPTTFKYNRNLQMVETSRGDRKELMGYDEQGRNIFYQIALGDGKAPITRNVYDEKGFLITNIMERVEIDGTEGSIEYVFTPDEMSRVKTVRLPQGTLQTYQYDNRGNLTKKTTGDSVEEYEVDLHGNITLIKQGGDVVQTFLLNGLDRPITITRKTGTQDEVQTMTYYPGGELKSRVVRDGRYGVVEEFTHDEIDELGRPQRMTYNGTTITPTYQYSYERGAVMEIGPRMTSRNTWNPAGHLLTHTNGIISEIFSPDGNGNMRSAQRQEDGATYNESFTFDPLDNVETFSDDLGLVNSYIARTDGRVRQVTNARNHVTEMDYTALGEMQKRRRADGLEFQFKYDPLRYPIYTGDPGAGFRQTYDNTIRLTGKTQRDGVSTVYKDFDPRDQPRKADIPGGTVEYVHDLKKRVMQRTVTYQSSVYQESFSYDAKDRVREARYRQGNGTENLATYNYDAAGPLLSARFQEDGRDFTVRYAYHNDRSRKSITYPSGAVINEERDLSGRLISISDTNGVIVRTVSWLGNNQPKTVELGNAMSTLNQYDARGRLTASRTTRNQDGAVLAHMRYELDPSDNIQVRQFLHRGGRADSFAYDSGERVINAQIGAIPISTTTFVQPMYQRDYDYHSGGLDYLVSAVATNTGAVSPPFASVWSGHDAFLLPGAVDGFNRSPADPQGNVQRALLPVRLADSLDPSPRAVALVHDGNGWMIRATRDDGVAEENFYQPEGLRYRRRIVNGTTVLDHRHFVYDEDDRLLEEYDVSAEPPFLIARYYYGTSDAPEAGDLYDHSTGELRRYYFIRDAVESVIAVADATGNVVERTWYDTFGQPFIEQRDVNPPALRGVMAGESGSLLIALSESALAPFSDPGPGTGIVLPPRLVPESVARVSINSTNVAGTWEILPSLEGYLPYSVLRFVPSEPLPATPSGVMGWWPGDAGVRDVIAGNNGVLRNGASIGSGVNQQAFSLNGNSSYVEIANASAANVGAGDFTVSVWINFNNTTGEQVVLEKWSQSARSGWSLFKGADQRLSLVVGGGPGNEFTVASAPLTFSTNVWIQVAARRLGSQFTLFTNGVQVATGTRTVALNSPATFKFGSREGTAAFFNGRLDEVILVSRALSDQELVYIAGGVAIPGPVTVTLNAGSVADEWGNFNLAETISFLPVSAPGAVYYAGPDPGTQAARIARSQINSPFLFQGQYFDYDTGLIYLRARFYDPFSGMFMEPDPLGYEDSVNLYAGMGNNPVSYRDPSGLNVLKWIGKLLSRGGRAAEREAPQVVNSGILKHADEVADAAKVGQAAAKKESSIVGLIKPRLDKEDDSLRDAYIQLVKSRAFTINKFLYDIQAPFFGAKKSASKAEIIETLMTNTRFAKVQKVENAIFSPNHGRNTTGVYWLQGDPNSGWMGRRFGRHELLHMGASINGQTEHGLRGIFHEMAVSHASTLETGLLYDAVVFGVPMGIGTGAYLTYRDWKDQMAREQPPSDPEQLRKWKLARAKEEEKARKYRQNAK